MPQLIEAGYVYAAQPPLFSQQVGRRSYYVQSERELEAVRAANSRPQAPVRPSGSRASARWTTGSYGRPRWTRSNRVLRQVTIEDAAIADEIFSTLMGDDVEVRKEFIRANAGDVRFPGHLSSGRRHGRRDRRHPGRSDTPSPRSRPRVGVRCGLHWERTPDRHRGGDESSFMEYSMSVIVTRALPDVRDGLKPVHRRILYGMYERGSARTGPYSKCARSVGEVMGALPPPRRHCHLRRNGADGPGLLDAAPARRRSR